MEVALKSYKWVDGLDWIILRKLVLQEHLAVLKTASEMHAALRIVVHCCQLLSIVVLYLQTTGLNVQKL